ncbi:Phosphoglycerate dehydrogenase [Caminicella sporogenes DSM 14501]|uniref:Phosphoglycerate dehydrogenase n=1 Tax=Caminicella sporogenes DSM 14501 TaxID=1121266 RepID=A0A1M6N4Y7_9FIRM|nr:phosphoglycerate dehydrogenase [Caminicella sporogenes]RKD22362.1 dihydrofolate reductase [Caminicella sporogenes]SHJ90712.1 Phosphoglycerate dehydrogenase [Caminicella sporogenes DSM 14501]
MKVLFTYDYGTEKMNSIKKLGYDVKYIYEREIINSKEIEDIDILVCYNPFNRLDITKLLNLKWIQLSSIGIDQAPIDYIKKKGIILTNNKGGYSIPMGEWIVLKILEIYKDSRYFYERQKEKKWKINTGLLELYGKVVGFLGTGTISIEAAKRLQGFGVKIYGLNTNGRNIKYFDKCFSLSNLDDFLAICDIIICAIPYTEKTHHLMNGERLSKMKKNSVLINVSRGSILDERDLIEKLKEGWFMGVALDVFENEPLSEDSPLWDFKNVYITPHNSWVSEKRNERRFEVIYENLKRYKNNEKLLNVVDLEKGY